MWGRGSLAVMLRNTGVNWQFKDSCLGVHKRKYSQFKLLTRRLGQIEGVLLIPDLRLIMAGAQGDQDSKL